MLYTYRNTQRSVSKCELYVLLFGIYALTHFRLLKTGPLWDNGTTVRRSHSVSMFRLESSRMRSLCWVLHYPSSIRLKQPIVWLLMGGGRGQIKTMLRNYFMFLNVSCLTLTVILHYLRYGMFTFAPTNTPMKVEKKLDPVCVNIKVSLD